MYYNFVGLHANISPPPQISAPCISQNMTVCNATEGSLVHNFRAKRKVACMIDGDFSGARGCTSRRSSSFSAEVRVSESWADRDLLELRFGF